jgi:hypothetical protein
MGNYKFKVTDKVEFYWGGSWIECGIKSVTPGSPCYHIKFSYKGQGYSRWVSTHNLRFKNPKRESNYKRRTFLKRFGVDL